MAVKYTIEKHAVAYPSNLLASEYGNHIYNVKLSTPADNGNLIGRKEWLGLELYKEAAATTFTGIIREQAANGNWYVEVVDPGDALFVYVKPLCPDTHTKNLSKESNFYNEANDIVKAYALAKGDIFEVSAEGFSGSPQPNYQITGVASKKLTVGEAVV